MHNAHPKLTPIFLSHFTCPCAPPPGAGARQVWRLRLLCFWLLWALAGPALAGSDVRSAAFLRDPGGNLTLAQVQAAPGWTPYGDVLSLGYVPYPVWLRLELSPHVADTLLRIRFRPAFVDEVRLFLPARDGGFDERAAGDLSPFIGREHSDTAVSFDWRVPALAASAVAPVPIFIRVSTTSVMTVYAEVLSPARAEDKRDLEQIVTGLYLGIMLMVLAWAVASALATRDKIVLSFAVYQANSTLMGFGLLGYASRYFFPDSAGGDLFTSYTVLLASVTGTVFHRLMLGSFAVPRPGLRLLDMALVIGVLNLGLALSGQVQWALECNAVLVAACGGLMLFPLAIAAGRSSDRLRAQLLLGYGALSAVVLLTMAPILGWVRADEWSLYLTNLHGLLTAAVLSALLAARRREFKLQADKSAADLALSRKDADAARAERDEKERFLAMLAHELRTPLSVIQLVLGTQAASARTPSSGAVDAQRAVDDINAVIERCVQSDQFERGALAPMPASFDAGALLEAVVADHPDGSRVRLAREGASFVLRADATLTRVVLTNLIDNSLKYSPDGATVSVLMALASRENQVNLLVRVCNPPNRAGRPDPEQVFAKYYRSSGAHARTGSGLGLYLVAGVARMLGGEVLYRTDLSEVCFEFWVPL